MSLFATDATLLAPPAPAGTHAARPSVSRATARRGLQAPGSASVAAPPPDPQASAAVWRAHLPVFVDAALCRGHVRAAAMLLEVATSHLDADDAAVIAARSAIDRTAALDAAMQQRQLAGDALVIPSLAETADGVPRFMIGLHWDELAIPVVRHVASRELVDGTQVELRNFLDEALRDTDTYIDLDPGIGVAVLTALSAPHGVATVRAVQTDPTLHAVLSRNIDRSQHVGAGNGTGHAGAVLLAAGMPRLDEFVPSLGAASRMILHLGSQPLDIVQEALVAWSAHPLGIVLDSDSDTAGATRDALEACGFSAFALATNGEEFELVPFLSDGGAEHMILLSPAYINEIEAAS